MRYPIYLTSALGASAALLLISCSGPGASSTSTLPSSALPSNALPSLVQSQGRLPADMRAVQAAATAPVSTVAAAGIDLSRSCPFARIYIADYALSDIEIYPTAISPSPKPCGIITQGILGPSGITVNNNGTLFVSDYDVNAVTVFPPNATAPSRTIFTAGSPEYAFVGADGTLYVPESFSNQIEVFAPGATSPELTIPVAYPWGVATDNKKNLYVVSDVYGSGQYAGHVIRFAPGATVGTDLGIAAPGFTEGIALTTDNSIVLGVLNSTGASISVYPPGTTTPSRSFPTIAPFDFALNEYETRIVVASSTPAQKGAVYDFKTGALVEPITTGLFNPDGAAFYPPAPY